MAGVPTDWTLDPLQLAPVALAAVEHYDRGGELWGISPLQDQNLAGAVMMIEGSLVTIAALAWLFLRLAQEGELRQELLERGLDPRAVRRAGRYGRSDELGRRI